VGVRVFLCWLGWVLGCVVAVPAWAAPPPTPPSADIVAVARTTLRTRDNAGMPVAVVDKRQAQLAVYDARGRLVGVTAALLGLMPGDVASADAARKVAQGLLPAVERTTPGGRYASQPGTNLNGERVVWIDYASALAIHRLRPAPAHERRAERLASPTPADNRITLGCVVVDPAFFDAVVLPTLGHGSGVVYVLRDDELPEP
jgi:YD repeat-containing protein